MKLTLIRHFKTRGNLERRYIGRTDEPLLPGQKTERKYPPGEVLLVSPMKRCIQTAEIIYPDQPQIVCTDFKECDFGEFEGKNYQQLKEELAYQEWLESGGQISFPAGEAAADFKQRCISGFKKQMNMLFAGNYQSAVMVVHGGTIMAIMEQFDSAGREFYHWQVENGGGFKAQLASYSFQLTDIRAL